jgi:amidohydrolase
VFDDSQIETAIGIRRDLHRHPELRFQERRTAGVVAERLQQLGYDVATGIAGTGVVGLLDTGRPGPVVALRADMDALPIQEASDLPHRSVHDGRMHACGHDGHTATLLLAADAIARRKDSLAGQVKLIFQPAEEGGNGAQRMVEQGVLEAPDVDVIFGYHNRPGFETGMIFVKPGSAMGGHDIFSVTIEGRAGHAAMPHLAIDPIYIGACVVQQIQGVVGRGKSPLHAGAMTVAAFQAGSDAANVIPGSARLLISVRNDGPATREALVEGLKRLVQGTCASYGAGYDIEHLHHVPPLVNNEHWAERVLEVASHSGLGSRVERIDYMPTMGAEDFAFYLQRVPGCLFFVGNGVDSAYLHNDGYEFNDAILPAAASVFVALVDDQLAAGTSAERGAGSGQAG